MDMILQILLDQSIRAVWLILAVLAVRLFFRRLSKNFRLVLWAMVAVVLLCPFTMKSRFSLMPDWKTMQVSQPVLENRMTDQNVVPKEVSYPVAEQEKAALKIYEAVKLNQNPRNAVGMLWFTGASFMVLYASISFLKLKGKAAVGLRLEKDVWLCDGIDTPFVMGVWKPQIYLPSGLSKKETEYILLHERVHVKRRDLLWKTVGFFLLTVYWFHPLVWVSYLLFSKDVELACDETVIRTMGLEKRKEYSKVLLSVSNSRNQVFCGMLAFGEIGVKERIMQILNYKKPGFWATITAAVLVTVLAVCFMTERAAEPSGIGTAEHKSFETAAGILEAMPEEEEELLEAGCVILDYSRTKGMDQWKAFYQEVQKGNPAEIILVEFFDMTFAEKYETENMTLNYLSYNGENFYSVSEFRPLHGYQKGYYEEAEFDYLKVFDYEVMNEEPMQKIVRTNIENLTADQLTGGVYEKDEAPYSYLGVIPKC